MLDTVNSVQTLAQKMNQGKLPVQEALRYAGLLAEALRKIHDGGGVHGAVSPVSVALTRSGLELLPALKSPGDITPYTAPELLQGRTADSLSDVFSFGAIVYEMLTGKQAFEGETREALAASILESSPAPTGSPAVDRLVGSCLAKDPIARVQRVQKLILELKLLAVAVRRSEAPARRDVDAEMRAEAQQSEARLNTRIGRIEQGISGLVERVSGIETALQNRAERDDSVSQRMGRLEQGMESAGGRFAAMDQRISENETLHQENEALRQKIASIDQTLKTAGARFESFDLRISEVETALKTAGDYNERLEQGIESLRQEIATLRENVSDDLKMFETALKHQAATVESARTAMAQTDDLVERVVEALESLQSVVLEHSDERGAIAN